jgi:hypothetical protein
MVGCMVVVVVVVNCVVTFGRKNMMPMKAEQL